MNHFYRNLLHLRTLQLLVSGIVWQVLSCVIHDGVILEEFLIKVARLIDHVLASLLHGREENLSVFHLARLLQPNVQIVVEELKFAQFLKLWHQRVKRHLGWQPRQEEENLVYQSIRTYLQLCLNNVLEVNGRRSNSAGRLNYVRRA